VEFDAVVIDLDGTVVLRYGVSNEPDLQRIKRTRTNFVHAVIR
jgi:hypothetical protein